MGVFDSFVSMFQGIANYGLQQEANNNNYEMASKNYELNKQYADLNYQNQLAQQAYTKQTQQTTWDREDNAVQRRAADLEAAGLSKTLAAGGAAQTSAPVHLDAAQHEQVNGVPQRAQAVLPDLGDIIRASMSTDASIQQSTAQAHLADMQANRVEEERKGLSIENAVKEDQLRQNLENSRRDYLIKGNQVESGKQEVDQAKLKTIMDQIRASIAQKYAMDDAQVENLARHIAAEVNQHDLDLSKIWGLRSSDHPDPYFNTANATKGALSEQYNQLSTKLSQDMERKQEVLNQLQLQKANKKAQDKQQSDYKKAMKDIDYARRMDLHQRQLNQRWN